ncbi:MAG: hypothetical protein R6X20_02195, partial [Phycisphaerae bacterium]
MRLRLAIELVPSPVWYINLRRAMPRSKWDRLRHEVYRAAGKRCQACGAEGRLNCHETWEYDDDAGVVRLKGFRALCWNCHAVCHLGAWSVGVMKGPADFDPAAHWCRINGLDMAAWRRHEAAAWATWDKRSERQWSVDLGRWADLVPPERRRGHWLRPEDEWPG